jgi:hypothetical protein
MIGCICLNCGKSFEVLPCQIRRGEGKYCSTKCYHDSHKSTRTCQATCAECGNTFVVRKCELEQGKGKYCSKKCHGISKTKSAMVVRVCLNCGKTFHKQISYIKLGSGKYCSKRCFDEAQRVGAVHHCENCGKEFYLSPIYEQRGWKHRHCSNKCKGEDQTGPKSSNWNGGSSFEPYCSKFNKKFKNAVRVKFDGKCYLCGRDESDNNRALAIHHIDYNKNSICNGHGWAFVPLCDKCHGKTVFDRWHWFNLLIYYWVNNIEGALDGIDKV